MGYIADRSVRILNALDALSFYVSGCDKLSIGCRLWGGLTDLGRQELEELVDKLNEAMRPIIAEYALQYAEKAIKELETAKQELQDL